MADEKKSFLLYADYIHTVRKMPLEKAGELFVTILAYVNDEEPIVNDVIVDLVFEPIKRQLKRDLEKWEERKDVRSQAGKIGGAASVKAKASKRKQTLANATNDNDVQANQAVNVNVTGNVIVNDNVINKQNHKNDFVVANAPKQKDIHDRKLFFAQSCGNHVSEFSKETVRAFFNYWSESNRNGKKMRFEMEKTFEIKNRLETWRRNEEKRFNTGGGRPKQSLIDVLQEAGDIAEEVLRKKYEQEENDLKA